MDKQPIRRPEPANSAIRARGVRVHNLKNIDVDVPRGKFVVVTGVSGSGKSSLALDTLYAEGQRRYVESFSAYARQFLERMDRPDVDRVENIPPAIAIERENPVKNRRSTVGTATELNDYLRLLFARIGHMFCPQCGRQVECHTVSRVTEEVLSLPAGSRFTVGFPLKLSRRISAGEQMDRIREMGFIRVFVDGQIVDVSATAAVDLKGQEEIEVVVDRLVASQSVSGRLGEAIETCYRLGRGRCVVRVIGGETMRFSSRLRCAYCDRDLPDLTPQLFSFNSPLGACPHCNGYGATIDLDEDRVVPDPHLSLRGGAVAPWTTRSTWECLDQLLDGAPKDGIPIDVPWKDLTEEQRKAVFEGGEHFWGVRDYFDWLQSRKYKLHVRVLLSRYRRYVTCPRCDGTRLREEARAVRVCGKNVAQISAMTIEEAHGFFHERIELSDYEQKVSSLLIGEIRRRLDYLLRIGLGYLTLDRLTRTLSGGEMQRVNLATGLASGLVNTLYILDEPSVGLHPRDNERLIGIIRSLKERGNTVLVVEHDRGIIESADHLIDLGPGAGERGGEVVYSGPVSGVKKCKRSVTGAYLRGDSCIPVPAERRKGNGQRICLKGAREHNLKGINVAFPIGVFICVTGVSGSGKSTLVQDTLYPALKRNKPGGYAGPIGKHDELIAHELVDDAILVEQSSIGQTPRSNPVTYVKAYQYIRDLFAQTIEARIRNLSPSAFSYNTPGGRCEHCQGAGSIKVDMQFLADVYVTCEKCGGRRFRKDILSIKYRGLSIHDVLEMTVEDAMKFFADDKRIVRRLRFLRDTGLGYLRLGQPATTLSGGESQRIKLAAHMAAGTKDRLLFIFDEPTVGLHFQDVKVLLSCIQALIAEGHTVITVEHNLDVVKCADYVIDLGPEEGERGGEVVAAGTPEQIAACERSHTGRYLKEVLSPVTTQR